MSRLGSWWTVKCILISLLVLLFATPQAQVHGIKHFGLDKNIFPSRIECIEQAKSGELLIGTLAGLVIYDGNSFVTRGVADGLVESSISAIHVWGEQIYIGHWTGNISVYNLKTDSFNVFRLSGQVNYSSVQKMIHGNENDLYILTEEGKLYTRDSEGVQRLVLPSIDSEPIIDVFLDASTLKVVLPGRIIQCDVADQEYNDWQVIKEASEQNIRYAKNWKDDVWFIGYEDKVEIWNFKKQERFHQSLTEGLQGFDIGGVERDLFGNYWITTLNQGVVVVHVVDHQIRYIKQENGLSYNQVQAVFIDREGLVWIATSAGLDQYLGDAFTLHDPTDGASGSIVWDLMVVHDEMYVASSNGIEVCELSQNTANLIVKYHLELGSSAVKQMVFDGNETVWALDQEGQIWKISVGSRQALKLMAVNAGVTCLELVNDALWLGTDQGIFIINRDNGRPLEHLTADAGLAGNRITGIYYSKMKNETWITALGSETMRYKDAKFKRFGESSGLTSTIIQDATFDKDGHVWFATYDKGVYYFQDERFKNLSERVKLTSETTFAIALDQRGMVWVGHNWGVDAYLPSLNTHEWYGEDQGFMGVEVNSGAMLYNSQSGLWMGTLMGVLGFNVGGIKPNPFEPLLAVKSAFLGRIDLLNNERNNALLHVDNDFSITFKGISLQNPGKNRYYYRLIGVHNNWKVLEKPGQIEYLSLPLGEFQFELKACNSSGICSVDPFRLGFSINPPFYRTWWFYTFLFLIIVGAIFLMDKYRLVTLLEEKSKLQERLEKMSQDYIELDQEVQRLDSQYKVDSRFISGIETKRNESMELPSEVLPNFNEYHLNLGEISSKSALVFITRSYKVLLMVDVGAQGLAAHALKSELINNMENKFPSALNPNQTLVEWKLIVQSLERMFPRYIGLKWIMCLDDGKRKSFAHFGFPLFVVDGENINEIEQNVQPESLALSDVEKEWFQLPSSKTIIAASPRMFDQLNEAGTRTFSKTLLKEIVLRNADQSQSIIANEVLTTFSKWMGSMEQFDDITLFIWNHE
ncbi:MAG: triple tyrosine motif-containing protein [Salibacteraceae bacterium]